MAEEVYLSIFDKTDGHRVTSLTMLGEVHGKDMDELKSKAAEEYPEDSAVPQTVEDWRRTVSGDLRWDGSELVDPPEPTPEEIADQEATQQEAEAKTTLDSITTRTTRMMLAQTALAAVPDAVALKMTDYFPSWDSASHAYSVGDRVMYDSTLYKCLQAHTSQDTWTPTDAPSLWAKVLTSTTGEPLPWEQPDSTNPYMIGDRVTYNGKVYESTIDNNVWSPADYSAGWKEIEG